MYDKLVKLKPLNSVYTKKYDVKIDKLLQDNEISKELNKHFANNFLNITNSEVKSVDKSMSKLKEIYNSKLLRGDGESIVHSSYNPSNNSNNNYNYNSDSNMNDNIYKKINNINSLNNKNNANNNGNSSTNDNDNRNIIKITKIKREIRQRNINNNTNNNNTTSSNHNANLNINNKTFTKSEVQTILKNINNDKYHNEINSIINNIKTSNKNLNNNNISMSHNSSHINNDNLLINKNSTHYHNRLKFNTSINKSINISKSTTNPLLNSFSNRLPLLNKLNSNNIINTNTNNDLMYNTMSKNSPLKLTSNQSTYVKFNLTNINNNLSKKNSSSHIGLYSPAHFDTKSIKKAKISNSIDNDYIEDPYGVVNNNNNNIVSVPTERMSIRSMRSFKSQNSIISISNNINIHTNSITNNFHNSNDKTSNNKKNNTTYVTNLSYNNNIINYNNNNNNNNITSISNSYFNKNKKKRDSNLLNNSNITINSNNNNNINSSNRIPNIHINKSKNSIFKNNNSNNSNRRISYRVRHESLSKKSNNIYINTNNNINNNTNFCPYCDHCNPIKNESLEKEFKSIFPEINQSKLMMKQYFDYIIKNDIFKEKPNKLFGVYIRFPNKNEELDFINLNNIKSKREEYKNNGSNITYKGRNGNYNSVSKTKTNIIDNNLVDNSNVNGNAKNNKDYFDMNELFSDDSFNSIIGEIKKDYNNGNNNVENRNGYKRVNKVNKITRYSSNGNRLSNNFTLKNKLKKKLISKIDDDLINKILNNIIKGDSNNGKTEERIANTNGNNYNSNNVSKINNDYYFKDLEKEIQKIKSKISKKYIDKDEYAIYKDNNESNINSNNNINNINNKTKFNFDNNNIKKPIHTKETYIEDRDAEYKDKKFFKIKEFKDFFSDNNSTKKGLFVNKIMKKCLVQNFNSILENPNSIYSFLPKEILDYYEKKTIAKGEIGVYRNKIKTKRKKKNNNSKKEVGNNKHRSSIISNYTIHTNNSNRTIKSVNSNDSKHKDIKNIKDNIDNMEILKHKNNNSDENTEVLENNSSDNDVDDQDSQSEEDSLLENNTCFEIDSEIKELISPEIRDTIKKLFENKYFFDINFENDDVTRELGDAPLSSIINQEISEKLNNNRNSIFNINNKRKRKYNSTNFNNNSTNIKNKSGIVEGEVARKGSIIQHHIFRKSTSTVSVGKNSNLKNNKKDQSKNTKSYFKQNSNINNNGLYNKTSITNNTYVEEEDPEFIELKNQRKNIIKVNNNFTNNVNLDYNNKTPTSTSNSNDRASNNNNKFNRLKSNKRKIIMYSLFTSILHILFLENKEHAILLYKFFKFFLVEIEKTHLYQISKLLKKIEFFEDLCKASFVKDNNSLLSELPNITDLLFDNSLSVKSLEKHKSVIKQLITINTNKQNEIYLLKTDNTIKENELNLFIHDYPKLKLNKTIREKLKELNNESIVKDIKYEMENRENISEYQILSLINSDRFLNISGQRSFIYDQKRHYTATINKLQDMNSNLTFQIRDLKGTIDMKNLDYESMEKRLEREINNLRQQLYVQKMSQSSQTIIDIKSFQKIDKNMTMLKILSSQKKNFLEEFIQKYNYSLYKEKPISKKSLLFLIAEIFSEKSDLDMKNELNDIAKISLDRFVYEMFIGKFKISKLVNKHLMETIIACFKYCEEDERVSLFSSFLGIKEKESIRREVLDVYLSVVRLCPFTFFDLFKLNDTSGGNNINSGNLSNNGVDGSGNDNMLITTEMCLDICAKKFPEYNLIYDLRDTIIKSSLVFIGSEGSYSSNNNLSKKSSSNVVSNQHSGSNNEYKLKIGKKPIYFFLNRFFNRCYIYISDLQNKMYKIKDENTKVSFKLSVKDKEASSKSNNNNQPRESFKPSYSDLLDTMIHANRDFNISSVYLDEYLSELIDANSSKNTYNLKKLVDLYKDSRYYFKIKANDFIEFILKRVIRIYDEITTDLKKYYNEYDIMKNENVSLDIYETFLTKIKDSKAFWRVNEIVNLIKLNRIDVPYVSQNEFVYLLLNISKVQKIILKKYCFKYSKLDLDVRENNNSSDRNEEEDDNISSKDNGTDAIDLTHNNNDDGKLIVSTDRYKERNRKLTHFTDDKLKDDNINNNTQSVNNKTSSLNETTS